MIISEKQITKLIFTAHQFIEILSLLIQQNIELNNAEEIRSGIGNLLKHIIDQQSEELKVIE